MEDLAKSIFMGRHQVSKHCYEKSRKRIKNANQPSACFWGPSVFAVTEIACIPMTPSRRLNQVRVELQSSQLSERPLVRIGARLSRQYVLA